MNTLKFTSSGISAGYESYGSWSSPVLTVNDARIVDFSIIDSSGKLVLPPLEYDETSNSTKVDLTSWTISGEWTAQKLVVQAGRDADPPVLAEDMLKASFFLNVSGSLSSTKKFKRPIPMPKMQDIPLIGKKFYASGFRQLVNGIPVTVTIPATGANRQWLEMAKINKNCLRHFQVFYDSSIIHEAILDSEDFPSGGKNIGHMYFIPENLKSHVDGTTIRKEYKWRCRISYKQLDPESTEPWPENLRWSEWSQEFTFKVNVPPSEPTELSVSAG